MSNATNVIPFEPRAVVDSKVLEAAWQDILKANIPPETHPEVIKMCKRFFYAGGKALVDVFLYTDCFDDSARELTTVDMNRFEGICNEVYGFFHEVAAQKQ